jgi:hypothetical protein
MSASNLIARLQRVRETGRGRWIALCPAHQDRRPSLGVRELEDGRVLVHCFAGCDIRSVVQAAGISFSDLFPARSGTQCRSAVRRGVHPLDALACVAHEARVVVITARMLQAGDELPADFVERAALAGRRIAAALDVAHG